MAKGSVKKKAGNPYRNLTEEQKEQYVFEAADNPYTESLSCDNKRIIYTGQFYLKMNELLESGMSAVQAYEACGYDTKKLGRQRAEAAANKAKSFAKGEDRYDWRNYSGLDDLETILQEKDKDILTAKMIAKIKTMEAIEEAQKKIMPGLLEKYTASNRNPKR